MWFGVLGPLLVRDEDHEVRLPAGRLRVLLAALLVRAGTVVPADALAEVMWDGSPPPAAEITLRSHVMRLRRVLGPSAGARVVTRYPGYLIQASEHEVDLLRFTVLARDGGAAARAGRWERAWELLGEALQLWRAEPLSDVPSDLLRDEQLPGLERARLEAAEWRAEAGLRLDRHGELVAELQSLVAAHPLRERFYGQLMLALVRSGRQAEALQVYQHAREVLAEELGTEPGAGLRQLHQQILTADPALAVPDSTAPALDRRAGVVPRQLPAAVADFTGRAQELAVLTRMLDEDAGRPGTVVISAIGGTPGVGKTALALYWAHNVADRFPDGQLHVNLRGFDPSGPPATPAEAVRGFLDALGIPAEGIPAQQDAQVGLYRSLVADRRMLIVLDNARDEYQVRPLLPASPGCLVLVTSRNQLAGLAAADGARLLSLDVLSRDEAVQMLTARLGASRAAAERDAVADTAELCACLPLALAVAVARAEARRGFALASLADELRDSAGRLDALDAGDPAASVRAVFSWSYRQLSAGSARMFRLLGLHPGPDISVPAAASLAGTDAREARRLLRELTNAHLVTEHVPGRYAFHDLLRTYATAQAHAIDGEDERTAAIGRVLDHYLHTASRASLLLSMSQEPITLAPPLPGTTPERPADYRQALAWFEAEHQVLLAAVTLAAESGPCARAWQLPWAIERFLAVGGHYLERVATQRLALAAATRLDDTAAQAVSSRLLAYALVVFGKHDQAAAHYATSLALYQSLGNQLGESWVHHNLGVMAEREGRYADALDHAEQALLLCRAVGDKVLEAPLLNNVGWYHALLGDYRQAREFCREALTLNEETGNRRGEGVAWDSLGYAEHHLGNFGEAAACYQHALSIAREFANRLDESEALDHLGDTLHAVGDLAQAREAWQQALAILDELQDPDAAQVRAKLASADPS